MPGARIYRTGTPFNAVELDELDFEQTADVVYMAHIDHNPTKLQRFGHTNWAYASITFGPTIAAPGGVNAVATTPNTDADNGGNAYFPQPASYVVTVVDADSGQESRASGAASCTNDLTLKRNYNTITWTAVANAERYRVYKQDNTSGFGWIGDTESTSFRDDNISADLTDSPPVGDNPFAGDGNKPSTVTFFEQRLLWARTKKKPNGVWGSKSADYENHDVSRPLRDNDALAFALIGKKVNAVNQMVGFGSQGLVCLSSDGTHVVNGGGKEGYLSPAQVVARKQSGRGASRLNPLELDTVIFFKTNVGNEVRSLGYSFEIDGVKTNDVTIFSPHFFRGYDIAWWAYAEVPRSIIWAGRSDGKLLCFTWEQDQQVWGWTICETDGFFESGCVIPENGEDRLYLVVRRTVGGVTKRFIERMSPVRWGGNNGSGEGDVVDSVYLDSAVRFNFTTPSSHLMGLDHLEGRTVNVLADGNVVTGLVVENGAVDLQYEVSKAVVGLPYVALVETLPLVLNTQTGSNQGRKQQAAEAVIRLVDSRGVEAGPADDLLLPVQPRPVTTDYGDPDPLGTGDYEVQMQPDPKEETVLVVRQALPLPFTMTAAFLDPVVMG